MMNQRQYPFLIILILIIVVLTAGGCNRSSEIQAQNDALKALLPSQEGYVWMYDGFAEYFQFMEIDSIVTEAEGYRYTISGDVVDMSGGDADLDYSISLEYLIQDGALIQIKQEEVMMDSIFDRIELIRFPLESGSVWTQKQTDRDGMERNLTCSIDGVRSEAGTTIYSIGYQDDDSEYYEKREIRSGVGVVSVETLWMTDEGNFPLQYFLYRSLGPDENT